MAIKIHHGPNGSYKTSGAIQDDAVPALKAGRLIITNVRGFTLERVLEVMPDLPDSVDIINLQLELRDDMEKMRSWFQWAPRGAFIIFDETQLVFPKSWREKDLARFDFPGGSEAADAADRPMDWLDGWTRHRHWNWDIVLTTPNISYIRDDIRMTSEMAYRHSNLAVIGISGRYKEAQHDAQLNRPPADGTIVEYKRIKPETFQLYKSTATGVAQDTTAGKSLFRSPKLLSLLVLMAGLLVGLLSLGSIDFGPAVTSRAPAVPATEDALEADPAPAQAVPDLARNLLPGPVDNRPPAPPPVELNHPFAPKAFAIRIVLQAHDNERSKSHGLLDLIDPDGGVLRQSFADLERLGYQLHVRSDCLVDIAHPLGYRGTAQCPGTTAQRNDRGQRIELNGITTAPAISPAAAPHSQSPSAGNLTVVPDSEFASRPWR
ncbi:zonular occludens toxin domain-containing protein [Pseudomonas tohonis]|uniref:zonular occludens toxin domain-containing protein n=1 Tax=Pseudomonas tohonis TaxID=2725477 RepID=UPI001F180E51|nr:zonular occludens toxin domain-containing protein [Pseudomonas tohonis]